MLILFKKHINTRRYWNRNNYTITIISVHNVWYKKTTITVHVFKKQNYNRLWANLAAHEFLIEIKHIALIVNHYSGRITHCNC